MYIYTYIKIPKFLRYEKTSSRVTSILYFVYGVIHSYHRTVKQEKYRGVKKKKKERERRGSHGGDIEVGCPSFYGD